MRCGWDCCGIAVSRLRVPSQAGEFLRSPRGALTQRGPDFFSRKRNRGKKRRRGELLVPLSTPHQKGGLLKGAAPFCGCGPPVFAVTCLAWQYNAALIGGQLGSNGNRLVQSHRSRTLAGVRIGGSAEGATPPLRFLSHRFLWQRKRCPVRGGRPCGEHKKGSLLQGCPFFKTMDFTCPRSRRCPGRSSAPRWWG